MKLLRLIINEAGLGTMWKWRNVSLWLIAMVPSFLLLLFFPPFFNNVDSACLYSFNFGSNIPHWQPGYLLFIRILNMFITGVFNMRFEAPVSHVSIYTTIVIQHVMASGALAYFSAQVAKSYIMRLSIMAVIALLSPLYFAAHGIYLESTIGIFLLLVTGMVVRLIKNNCLTVPWMIGCSVLLFGLMLIRHEAVVYSFIVILGGFIVCYCNKTFPAKIVLVRICLVVLCPIVASMICNKTICFLYRVKIKNIVGRAGIYFLYEKGISDEATAAERSKWLAVKMQKSTDDELLKKVIPYMFHSSNLWLENYQKTREIVREAYPEIMFRDEVALADRLLEKFFYLYIRTVPWLYAEQVILHYNTYLFHNTVGMWQGFFGGSVAFYEKCRSFDVFKDTKFPFDVDDCRNRYTDIYLKKIPTIYSKYPTFCTIIVFLLISTAFIWRKSKCEMTVVAIVPAIILVVMMQLMAVSIAQPVVMRYAIGASTLLIMAVAIIINAAGELVSNDGAGGSQ